MNQTKKIKNLENLADNEFGKYEFGDGITVVDSDGWNTDDEADLIKVVYPNAP